MPSFAYEVQTAGGYGLTGVLAAADQPAAQALLESLQFRVLTLRPDDRAPQRRGRPISGSDFRAFNQQLAYLTAAGLPVEQGLRLIAQDVLTGRLAGAVADVIADLDRGISLADAFARRKGDFPPLYSTLVAAGVKTNNLPAMLLSLGRHMDLLAALRGAVWRSLAYPLVIFLGFMGISVFISMYVVPHFREIFSDFRTTLPWMTEFVINAAPMVPVIVAVLVVLLVALPLTWHFVARMGVLPATGDAALMIPLVGKIMRCNMIARWCDALQLGVEAGLGLPEAMTLAGEAVGSPALARDTAQLVAEVSAGRRIDGTFELGVLPRSVVVAIYLGSEKNDLPHVLENMVEMYRYRAQQQVSLLPGILMPIFLIVAGGGILFTIFSLFLPLLKIMNSFTGGEGGL